MVPKRFDDKGARMHGRWTLHVCAAALLLVLSGCTYNPLLGKWKIDQRTKETDVTYLDPLSHNIKKHTGNDTIEFLKDSIVISGGPQAVTEDGIHYQTTELEGGPAPKSRFISRARTTPTIMISTFRG